MQMQSFTLRSIFCLRSAKAPPQKKNFCVVHLSSSLGQNVALSSFLPTTHKSVLPLCVSDTERVVSDLGHGKQAGFSFSLLV